MLAPDLSKGVVEQSRGFIDQLNGMHLGYMLALHEKDDVADLPIQHAVAVLLADSNRFVRDKDYQYLVAQRVQNQLIKKALQEYAQRKF